MEFPIIVIAIVSMAIGLSAVSFWLGFYFSQLNTWFKFTRKEKIYEQPNQESKRSGNTIVEGKYYDAGNQE